jgi:hypothetical protein
MGMLDRISHAGLSRKMYQGRKTALREKRRDRLTICDIGWHEMN